MSQSFIKKPDNGPHSALSGLGVLASEHDDQRPTAEEDADFDRQATERDPRYPARKAASEALDKHIREWIDGYEFDDGECCIAPDEQASFLIYDAFAGLTGDDEYQRLHAAWRALCGPVAEPTWQAMIYAPLDGTEVDLLLHHPNHRYAKGEAKKEWEQVVSAKWIDFNGGGWCWHGMSGTPMGWRHTSRSADNSGASASDRQTAAREDVMRMPLDARPESSL